MKSETITVKLDKVAMVKATSRSIFSLMPKSKRIGNKKKRPEKYKKSFLMEETT